MQLMVLPPPPLHTETRIVERAIGSLVTVPRSPFGRTTHEVYSNNQTYVLSTDQEMIPAKNVTDAHAQDFVVKDEFLLTSLKAFARTAYSFKLCHSKCSMFSVCVQWLSSLSLLPKAAQNSPPPALSQQPTQRA